MRNINEDTITQAVLASLGERCDARLRTIFTSLIQHLHSFARDVRLTEAEWLEAVRFLTETGRLVDGDRQELILLSDTLGLSTLVMAQNDDKPVECTEATIVGPFHVADAVDCGEENESAGDAQGTPCFVSGQVRSRDGGAVVDACIDVWQSSKNGYHVVQSRMGGTDAQAHKARGRLRTDADGCFRFHSVLPQAYAIPHDGPVGSMLNAMGRHPWRPAHLHCMIEAPGYETLITHIFRADDAHLDSDVVFGVRSTLIADWVRHPAGVAPDGVHVDKPFYVVAYDFVLNPVSGDKNL